jgi:hypothetical protein
MKTPLRATARGFRASEQASLLPEAHKLVPNKRSPAQDCPNPIEIFRERCGARALLVAEGVLDLQTAVDVLQFAAKRSGLIEQIGQDAVQEIMSAAFNKGGGR